MIPTPTQNKAKPHVSKNVKTSDVQTYLAKETSTDGDFSEKDDECVPEQAAHERRSKKKVDYVINVDNLTYDEEPLTNIFDPGIAKRFQRRKGKVVMFEDYPSKEIKRKYGGMKSTPSRSSKGKYLVGPARSWSKVDIPTRNRKVVSSSDYMFEFEEDVQDTIPVRRYAPKNPYVVVPEAPLENMSLHYVKNDERWKYVIQRRISLERELDKDALKCKEVMELIEATGLMKNVTTFGLCYEGLVKKFVVTIPDGFFDMKREDYRKVYVRVNVVTFSLAIINKLLGRIEEPQAEIEVTNEQVCKEIIDKQVLGPTTSKGSAITQLKETCKELDDYIWSITTTKIKLEKMIKDLMDEEEKEVKHLNILQTFSNCLAAFSKPKSSPNYVCK
ncbi:uncharacterized protein LOC127104059 [Lathyrus oleraceus]|uniref:uncharacterized protein LOC127104059 n=1 Tax=Pisum sativum TaxID=3888 RepID=UPI0021CE7B62|nr:uncharacterized protein LOC127104059 [Pisum sativum]